MNKLEIARQQINEADREIAKYFEKRMKASQMVAEYKLENMMPIFDPKREAQVIENNKAFIDDPEIRSFYALFQQNVMDVSKMYQRRLVEGMRVAYSGVEGAYAHIAAKLIFPDANHVPYGSFEEAYEAVVNGESDCVVLPIENSTAGEVGGNMDMIYAGPLTINGMYELKITHNLLAKKGTAISEIKTVCSHVQAIQQCYEYIKRNGFATQNVVNTAVAAKMVAESGDRTIAAIASRETAKLYGLEIIAEAINESTINTTRFAVLSRADTASGDNKLFTLGFTVNHEAGALAKVIKIIAKYDFNMHLIKSRPLKDELWRYYFFTEIEGNLNSEAGRKLLEGLKEVCINVRVIGAYGDHTTLEE